MVRWTYNISDAYWLLTISREIIWLIYLIILKIKKLTFPDHVKISTRAKELIKRLVVKDPLRRCNWEFFFNNKSLASNGKQYKSKRRKSVA